MGRGWGITARSRGRRNHNQHILCEEKKSIFNKKKRKNVKLRRGNGIHPKLYTEIFHLNIMHGIRECDRGGGSAFLLENLRALCSQP